MRLVGEMAAGVPATVVTDETRLRQILKNLLSNALKFTQQGEITLRCGRPAAAVPAGWLEPERAVIRGQRFRDRDRRRQAGGGFRGLQQADGTTSRKFGGTGLGLSISRQLARLLGGELSVSSREGEGATFTLWLPERLSGASRPRFPRSAGHSGRADESAAAGGKAAAPTGDAKEATAKAAPPAGDAAATVAAGTGREASTPSAGTDDRQETPG
ncbi:MAG: ATP-binding protein [Desulfurivibrio sp.]|nr:ATP-binding protein [Desulfurivibrio sp.]